MKKRKVTLLELKELLKKINQKLDRFDHIIFEIKDCSQLSALEKKLDNF